MVTTRITEANGSAVIVLSKEMLAQLGARTGDEIKIEKLVDAFDLESSLGSSPSETAGRAAEQVAAARVIMEKRYDVLRRLAE
jgi:antitoxin component of MazEF toxin-antitoxin module